MFNLLQCGIFTRLCFLYLLLTDEGEPDVLRVSTMMTVQLHQQLSVSAQEPLRQSDDFHGVWVSLPELDEGVWTFVDEQTAMFVRLGLMLTGDRKSTLWFEILFPPRKCKLFLCLPAVGGGDPAYDTKSTSSSSGRPDTHSASLPGAQHARVWPLSQL